MINKKALKIVAVMGVGALVSIMGCSDTGITIFDDNIHTDGIVGTSGGFDYLRGKEIMETQGVRAYLDYINTCNQIENELPHPKG